VVRQGRRRPLYPAILAGAEAYRLTFRQLLLRLPIIGTQSIPVGLCIAPHREALIVSAMDLHNDLVALHVA